MFVHHIVIEICRNEVPEVNRTNARLWKDCQTILLLIRKVITGEM